MKKITNRAYMFDAEGLKLRQICATNYFCQLLKR